VGECRLFPPECVVQSRMSRCRYQPFLWYPESVSYNFLFDGFALEGGGWDGTYSSTNYMCNLHQVIIDNISEVVCREPIPLNYDEVV